MSRSRRARVPITATLISLAMASTTLFGTPAQAAAQVPPRDAKAAAPVSQVAPKAPKAAADPFSVLVFSKTAGFRHDSIPAGIAAIQQLGAANGFTVDATEDAAAFTDANLAKYAGGDLAVHHRRRARRRPAGRVRALHPGRRRLRRRARRLRHRVRLALVRRPGRRVLRQPPGQPARRRSRSRTRPTRPPPACRTRWTRTDEWYNFRTNPRGDVHVLVTPGRDARYTPAPARWAPTTRSPGASDYDGGRVLVHRRWATPSESYSEPDFRAAPARRHPDRRRRRRRATAAALADRAASRRSRWTATPATRWSWTSPRTGGCSTSSATAGCRSSSRTPAAPSPPVDLNVYTGDEDGLLGIALDPDFATNGWVYLYYSPPAAATASTGSPASPSTGDTLDLASEKVAPRGPGTQRDDRAATPAASIDFDRHGNLYLGHRRQHQPVRPPTATPRSTSGRAGQHYDAQRTAGNTNDLRGKVLRIHPEADGTLHHPGGQPVPAGHREDPARDLRDGLPQPVPVRRRPEDQRLRLPRRLRPGRAAPPTPTAGPEGTVEWNIDQRSPATTAGRTASATTRRTTTTTSPPAPSGAKFNCAAPVNNSPNNTGLTNLPPAVAGHRRLRLRRQPALPGDRRRRRADGRPGLPLRRRQLVSDRKFPAYYDGKAVLLRVGQQLDVHDASSTPTARRWWTSTRSCPA